MNPVRASSSLVDSRWWARTKQKNNHSMALPETLGLITILFKSYNYSMVVAIVLAVMLVSTNGRSIVAQHSLSGTPPGYPPSLKPGCLKPDSQNVDLWCPGDGGYGCYKIPTLLRTANGTLLGMIEARKFSCDDRGYIDLQLRRSHDDGKTWGPSQFVYGNSTDSHWTSVGDANMVQDATTGTIWLLHTRNNSHMFMSYSGDEGASWSSPRDVTASLKLGYPTQSWIGTGHAGGIQLSNGPHKGRLIIPAYSNTSYTVYSDDHGKTWGIGGGVGCDEKACGGENQMAETGSYTVDGTPILIMSTRNSPKLPPGITGEGYRLQALSHDGGLSWGAPWEAKDLPEPIKGCDGSIVYHPGTNKLYFSHPDPPLDLFRTRLRIWSSSNMGASWESLGVVWPEAAGYSALVVMHTHTTPANEWELGVLYDRNNHTMVVFEAQGVSFTTMGV